MRLSFSLVARFRVRLMVGPRDNPRDRIRYRARFSLDLGLG